jgi:hypothetical protein
MARRLGRLTAVGDIALGRLTVVGGMELVSSYNSGWHGLWFVLQ